MPLSSEARIVPSSITGCETRLRSRNPWQEAVPLALGKWRGFRVKRQALRWTVLSSGHSEAAPRQVARALRAVQEAQSAGSRFWIAARKQARDTENTQWSLWLVRSKELEGKTKSVET